MSCDCTEKVSLLMDGELTPAEMHEVERHLLTCAECRQARFDFAQLRQQITAYPVRVDLHAQRRALAEILAPQSDPAHRTLPPTADWGARLRAAFAAPHFSPAWAAACALVLVACAVAFVVYRNTERRTSIAQAPSNSPRAAVPATADANKEVAGTPRNEQQSAPRNEQPGMAQHLARGAQQATIVNSSKRAQPGKPAAAQTASVKLPREQRAQPVRLPQVIDEREPAYVAVSASDAATARALHNRPADAETLTARHVEQAELLLRAFRNARADRQGAVVELSYEKQRAQQMLYQNMLLRREAADAGNVQVAGLLDSLEPILLDIANLPAAPSADEVSAIKERVQRKNLVALLQVNSVALARAYD
ncbi:MAG TPA: zf-HC2 domain-containing protein [Pyrinomonadaceae bacterium]|jgi:hypothetical protein